ncbi:hypothetical protein [Aestuariimicrobium ganziense]|uniref:hypothetical protein n=1 Tax=Aestuariimicrobium ganziense TaxID=2773677 RepID=UPI0019444E6F|nr:hypothetical protein [Aestuariimicrobium ganziense]
MAPYPLVFATLAVERSLGVVPATIEVCWSGEDDQQRGGLNKMKDGERYLLFTNRSERDNRTSLQDHDDLHFITDGPTGAFSVSGEQATMLGDGFDPAPGEQKSTQATTYPVDELLAVATRT